MKQRKIPLRSCIGCGEQKPKKELIRIVKSNTSEITLDNTGKKPGRGAYVCNSVECFKKAKKSKRLERAFSCQIPIEIYERLEEELKKDE